MQEIPEQDPIDLAIIAVPARVVKTVMQDCVEVGVRGAIIISAGFKETGEEGAKLEKEILDVARRGGIRVIGPNCLGVMVCSLYYLVDFSRRVFIFCHIKTC